MGCTLDMMRYASETNVDSGNVGAVGCSKISPLGGWQEVKSGTSRMKLQSSAN